MNPLSLHRLLTGCLVSLLLACTGLSQARETVLTPVTVDLSWKYQFESAGFFAAISQGYYREAGLEVSLREWEPGRNPVAEIVAGTAQFGMSTSTLLVDRDQGKPVVALAALNQHSPVSLLVRRTGGVSSVLDLAGKRIAYSYDTENEIVAYLSANGLSQDKYITLAREGLGIEMLTSGKADAIGIYSTNEAFHALGREEEYLLLTPQSAGVDFFGNLLYTSESLVHERPELVAAFRAATLRGLDYALRHPEELTDLILEHYNTQHKSRAHLLYEAHKLYELTRPDIVEPGYMSRGRWQHVAEIYRAQGKLTTDVDLDAFIYDPVPKGISPKVLWLLAGTLIALLGTLAVLWQMRRFNQRLQGEIAERKAAVLRAEQAYNELQSTQASLVEAEKMASLGGLVAGIAHEINTPVGITLTSASVLHEATRHLRQSISDGAIRKSEVMNYMETAEQGAKLIMANAERAAHLIQSFKQVAVDQTSEMRRSYALGHYLHEVLASLRPALKRGHVDVTVNCPDDLVLDGYPGALAQIITNLVTNALAHAFADAQTGADGLVGHIHIAVSVATDERQTVTLHFDDNGVGIPQEHLGHIFDPFYTTRRGQGGTGLGLNIVHNIMHKQFAGSITASSTPGQGSRFSLSFPRVSPQVAPAPSH